MAKSDKSSKKKKSTAKPTMRELASSKETSKSDGLKDKISTTTKRKLKSKKGKRSEKIANNRIVRFLKKLGSILVPKYFKESWREIRLTTWPGRRETIRLSFAVFVFAAVFAAVVASLDFVLDKIFKEIILR